MTTFNILEKVIPDHLIDAVQLQIDQKGWHYGWHSNRNIGTAHWNIDFGKAASSNGIDISKRIDGAILELWQHLQKTHTGKKALLRCYTNSHTYGVEGYPHTDSRKPNEETLVIYLNKEWRKEWGGETLIYDKNDRIVHAELPKFNTALRFNSNQYHCARGVTRVCPTLRVTLMFKFGIRNGDPDRDRLQLFLEHIGADKLSHTKRNLDDHLLGTYDTLKIANQSAAVCLAGGAHSIFGTNSYTQQALSLERRAELVAVIGEEATCLVDYFRIMDRPRVLENWCQNPASPLTTTEGRRLQIEKSIIEQLCMIECANLHDQSSFEKHPALNRLWEKVNQ